MKNMFKWFMTKTLITKIIIVTSSVVVIGGATAGAIIIPKQIEIKKEEQRQEQIRLENEEDLANISIKLKTDDSYRTVPMHPRLKEVLLKHKEEQKERFRNSIKMKKKRRYWHENEYVSLSKTYTPYLSGSLAKGMREFCKKYQLPKVQPYSLRTSFATNNAERKVDKLALKTAMGHAKSGNTIEQYYILPTENYMKEEFNKVFST